MMKKDVLKKCILIFVAVVIVIAICFLVANRLRNNDQTHSGGNEQEEWLATVNGNIELSEKETLGESITVTVSLDKDENINSVALYALNGGISEIEATKIDNGVYEAEINFEELNAEDGYYQFEAILRDNTGNEKEIISEDTVNYFKTGVSYALAYQKEDGRTAVQITALDKGEVLVSTTNEAPTADDARWTKYETGEEYIIATPEENVENVYVWYKNGENIINAADSGISVMSFEDGQGVIGRITQLINTTSTPAFNNENYMRKDILTITLSKTNNKPANSIDQWDVSQNKDGSVWAYIVQSAENITKYDLYICGNGALIAPRDSSTLFCMYFNCKEINGLENLDVSNVTNMTSMFDYCKLTSLEALSGWNISNVMQMKNMFRCCTGLTSLEPLKNWNVGNVKNMYGMFVTCSGLTSLEPLKDWNVGNVTDMGSMFTSCSGLTSLEGLSSWNVGNVTDMDYMFRECSGLTSLEPLKDWNVGNVTNMMYMFENCSSLTSIEALKDWNVGNVTDMGSMFAGCSGLTSLEGLSSWNVGNVENMVSMFNGCSGLTNIEPLKNWKLGSITTNHSMFKDCTNLKYLLLSNNFDKIQSAKGNFSYLNYVFADKSTSIITLREDPIEFLGSLSYEITCPATLYVKNATVEKNFEAADTAGMFGPERIKEVIELVGDSAITVKVADEYTDPGAMVAGYPSADLAKYPEVGLTFEADTSAVDNAIKNRTPGQYDVIYTLKHNGVAFATKTRKVTVTVPNYKNDANQYFTTLAEAFNGTATGGTITVLENVQESTRATLTDNKSIILDLNGKTITYTSEFIGVIDATLEVKDSKDNGEINNTTNYFSALYYHSNGNIIISGGTIKGLRGISRSDYGAVGASVTMTGGQINATSICIDVTTEDTVVITGGKLISSTDVGINYAQDESGRLVGSLTIGTKGGAPNTQTPMLQGETYAINSVSGFEFYDGILKGKTGAFSGSVTAVEPGYGVHYDTEGEYQTATLVDANYQDNKGNYYVTLADAFAKAPNGGSITVLRNVTDASDVALVAGKMITLNTDGKTITKTEYSIKNYGTLTIEGNGTIQTPESTNNSIVKLIQNWGILNLNNVTTIHKGSNLGTFWWYTILSWNGEVNINNSTIESSYDKNIAKPSSHGGRTIGIFNNSVLNMNSGRIIESTGIQNAVGVESYALDSNNGRININGGTIECDYGLAIRNYDYGEGTLPNNFVINILGGTISSKNNDAIWNTAKESTIIIGKKDGVVDTKSPEIISAKHGIYSDSGFKFYDGILKGKTAAFYGNVTDIEPGYGIHYDTEGEYQTATLVDANYQDNKGNYYATLADAFAKAPSGSTITVLRDVTDNSQGILTSGKTLTLELNGKTINAQGSESIINNQGKLTIQDSIGGGNISRNINALSNYMISNSSEMIITGGKFAINKEYVAVCISSSNILKIENAEIETSIINTRNTGDNLTAGIVANGETIINNTKITSRAPSSIYTCGGILCNAGAVSTITLNNVNIDSDIRGIILVNHAGTGGKNGSSLTVQGSSSITGKKYGIYNEYAVGGITIDGGTISGGSAGIYQNANNTITLNNGIITGGRGVQIDNGTFDMKGGKVEASVNAVETTHGKLIIRNGEVVGGPTATSLVNFGNGYIEVIGGTVSGGYAGIFSSKESAGEVRIKGGSIIDRSYIASDPASGSGIYNAGSTNIYVEGEEISAALRGIYNLGTGTVTIGTSGGGVNTAVPSIQGGTYGIDSTNGFEFYDGILKGKAGAFNGNVTDIEPGYGIHYDTEGEYQTATLVDANYQDNKGNYYVTLADAFAGALDGGSITVLRNVTDASNATLAAEKTITLNTDGKTITKTENSIKNYGTLTIEGNGKIQTPESTNNSIVRLIENWGKINLNDVTILHKGPNLPCWWYTVLSWNGEVNINNSTIEATYDKNIAKPTSGGGRTIGILNNSVLNMNSGRIIESTGMSSAVTIESYTIDSNNGKININSGTIESDCGYAIYNYDYWDGVTQPVINNFVINILGGTITSNTTSAIINGGAYSTITIGTLDGGVNTISPSIQGETYGIESTNGFKFYDGILKGKTGAFTGSVTEVEPGYGVHYDTEGEYQTATLVDANYQDNKGNYYVTLADAFAKAQDGSTITTLRDVTENTRAIANKTLTLDLNGKTIDASGVTGYWELGREFIQNQGTLTIIDTNGNGTITRNNVTSHVCVISTTGTLNLKGGTFSLSIENIEYDPSTIAVDSGTTNIYDGVNIIATRTVIDQWIAGIYAPGGILNMYGGNVEATGIEGSNTVYGIINRSDGTSTINISGGTVRSTGKGIALENHGGNIVNSQLLVSGNATIQGNLYGIYNSAITGGITIDGGTISGGRYGIYQTVDNNITTSGNINGGTGPAILIGSGTCTVNIMGGTIKTTSPDADAINLLDKSNVTLNVTNATIISGSGPYSDAIDKDGGTGDITIDGDSVLTGEQAAIINQGTGNVIIKNGILTSNSGAITSEGGGNIIIENGTITGKSNTMSAVHIKNSATLTIRGGSIISEGTSAVRSYNTAKIIIGTQGSGVSTILPMIQGATYGVDAVNGFEFYDGILKGKTGAFNGTVTKMEPGYGIHYDTEGDYKTAYLVVANYEDNATLKNTYDTLADAFAKAPDGSTITVIGENVQESTLAQLIIKSMVLDLNGKTITYSGNVEAAPYIVVQAGNLEVKDTKGNGKINNTTNYYSVLYYHYGGKIIISGGTLTGIEGIARQSEGATGTITITGGTIDTTSSCIEFDTGTSITITGGNLICSEGSCILQTSAVKTDSTITIGTQGSGVSTTSPSIQGETYAINSVSGFEFYDGILKGKSAAFKGEVTEVEPDYEVHYDTEGSYYTATLQPYTGSVHINPTIAFTNIDKVVNKQINATIIFKATAPLTEITIQGETIDVSTVKPTVSGIEYVYEIPYTITQNGVYVATCRDATGRVAKKEQAINAFHTLMVEYEITNSSAYSDETRITFTAAYPFRILSTNPESYKDQVKNTSLTGYAMVNTMLITDDALDVTFIFEDEQGNQSNEVHVQIAGVALKFVRAVAPTESHFKAFTTMDVETAYRLAQEMENKIFVVNEKVESYYGVNKHESDLFMSRARDVGAAITLMSANKTSAFDGTVASDQGGNPKAQIDQYGLQNVGSREEYMASYLKDATQNSLTNADAKYRDVVNNLDTLRLYKGFALKTQDSSEGMFFVRTGLTSYALKTNTPFENTTFRITIVNP